MKKTYIVWNKARNEAFVTLDEGDANTAATGRHTGSHSALAMDFFDYYGDEKLKVERL